MQNTSNPVWRPPVAYGTSPEDAARRSSGGAAYAGGSGTPPSATPAGSTHSSYGSYTMPPKTPYKGAGGGGSDGWTPYSAPGYAEDYYNAHKGFYDQPGAASQYWNGQQGFFANPSYGENQLNKIGDDLYGSKTPSEDLYKQYYESGAFTKPGASEDFWSKYGSQMMDPSQGEAALGKSIDQLGAKGAGETWWDQHQYDFDRPGVMEQMFPEIKGQLIGKGYQEKYADAYKPEDSAAEQFLNGGGAAGGLDAMYDRLYTQGAKRIDDAGGARGSYNSGRSLRAGEELSADLTGRHVQDLQAAVSAADTAKMARLNYGENVMKGADTGMTNRLGTLGDIGSKTQQATLDRLLGGSTASDRAQGAATARYGALTNASKAQGDLSRERMTAGSEAADRAQKALFDRMKGGMDFSKTSGDQMMDRLNHAGAAYGSAQDRALNRIAQGGQLAQAAGTEDNTRIAGGQAASKIAQDAMEGRQKGVVDNLMNVARSQADTYSRMSDQQRSEELQLKMSEIQGRLQRGEIDAGAAKQLTDLYTEMLKAPIAAAGAKRSTPTPASGDPNYTLPMS